MATRANWLTFYITVLGLVLSYSVSYVFDTGTILVLTREDGFFEYLSAILFFFSSVMFFLSFLKDKSGNDLFFFSTKKNLFFLFLSIIFLFGAGEEISWGQRLFGFETPNKIQTINEQMEFNIHNLNVFYGKSYKFLNRTNISSLLIFNRVFDLFWISFCILLPFSNKVFLSFSLFFKRINLPIPPTFLGALFLINAVFSQIVKSSIPIEVYSEVAEIKEANFSLLFFLISIYFFGHFSIIGSKK